MGGGNLKHEGGGATKYRTVVMVKKGGTCRCEKKLIKDSNCQEGLTMMKGPICEKKK